MNTPLIHARTPMTVVRETPPFVEFGTHHWPWLNLSACTGRFAAERFCDSLFAVNGVAQPACLSRAVTTRRAEFLAGRLCAARALRGLGTRDQVGVAADRSPVWPPGTIGSISHCGPLAMAVARERSLATGIGIDIESRQAFREAAVNARHVLSDAERGVLTAGGVPRGDQLILAFSMKESFFKAAYPQVRRYFDFAAVRISDADPGRNLLLLTVAQNLAADLVPGHHIVGEYSDIGPDHIATALTV